MGKKSFNLLLVLIFLSVPTLLFSQVDTAWVRRYNGSGNGIDQAVALGIDNYGNVYVTGYSYSLDTDYDIVTLKYDTDGNLLWERRYNGPADSGDYAVSLAIDADTGIYVVGSSFGVGTGYDYVILKYDAQGNLLWERRYNGSAGNDDRAVAIAIDRNDYVYVTGTSYHPSGAYDVVTLKYDKNGNLLWERRHIRELYQEPSAITVDINGNVYITGYTLVYAPRWIDYLTLKYDANGNLLWERLYNGPGNSFDEATALTIDGEGNVYVTGRSWGTSYDFATLKYNVNGDLLWERRYNGPGNGPDEALAIQIDSNGNIYVTGQSWGVNTSWDIAILKYDSEGNLLWESRYNGPENGSDEVKTLIVDTYGNLYLTGASYSFQTHFDYLVLKYNTEGNLLWEKRYDGNSASDRTRAIALDNDGNIYVTGSCTFSTSDLDYVTIKYVKSVVNVKEIKENKIKKTHLTKNQKVIYDLSGKPFFSWKRKKGVYFIEIEKKFKKVVILK